MKSLSQSIMALKATYPPAFLDLIAFVMSHEVVFNQHNYGDYDEVRTEHDPRDPGGATKYGIDQRSHHDVKVSELTFDTATEIYFHETWCPLRAGELPPKAAFALCDAAINCGAVRAVRWLQEVIGVKIDGNLGPMTILACKGYGADADLAKAFNRRRMKYYREEVNQGLRITYLKGWTNRVNDLTAALA